MLRPGKVLDKVFFILIDISPIRSDKVIQALHDHFVLGHQRVTVCDRYKVSQGYLSKKIKEIQYIHKKLDELFHLTYKSHCE